MLLIFKGRSLGVVPREEALLGYMDLEHDDYQEGDFLKQWQEVVLRTAQRLVVCFTLAKICWG